MQIDSFKVRYGTRSKQLTDLLADFILLAKSFESKVAAHSLKFIHIFRIFYCFFFFFDIVPVNMDSRVKKMTT